MKAEQLRKSILQLAIQGKLVPQDPADEPASVLLERIRTEKQRLIKEGKIKKDKGDSVIFKGDDNCYYEKTGSEVKNITDEIPFDIPDSWCWVRFPHIVNFALGKTPDRHTDKYWNNGVYPWFSIADMQDKKIIETAKEKISTIALSEKFNNMFSPKGTLLMSFKLTVGRTSILGVDAVHNEAIISIFPYVSKNNITRDYLMNTLGLLVDYVKQTDAIKGSTLNSNKLQKMFVPFPPLAEQERIVSEIEKFEPLIAEYDKLEQQATKLDGEIYDTLKKSILQYAIQGKLVPQDSNDEPAAVLLERIRAEKKAQLGKKYVESYIYKGDDNCYYEHINGKDVDINEEIPYDLPDSWSYVRFNDITKIITCGYAATPHYVENGMPFLSAKNVKPYNFKPQNYKKISYDLYAKLTNKNKPEFNDILMTRVGAGIGEACIIDKQIDFAIYVSLTLIKLRDIVLSRFVLHWLNSPFGISTALKNIYGRDSSQGNLNVDNVRNYLFPLPPLAEQKRIVDKIDEIFAKL